MESVWGWVGRLSLLLYLLILKIALDQKVTGSNSIHMSV